MQRKQPNEADIKRFYEAFRKRLKVDTIEDISDLQYAINSADLISKELSKHDFTKMVKDRKDTKLAKDLALDLITDVKTLRKRYNLLKKLLKGGTKL